MACFVEYVDHAQITVPKNSEQAAREFYCGFLGIHEIAKPKEFVKRGGFWLGLGAVHVHIGLEDGVDRWMTKSHVAYQVRGLNEWAVKLRERGIEVVVGDQLPGFARFEFRDPFGNRVEFMERIE